MAVAGGKEEMAMVGDEFYLLTAVTTDDGEKLRGGNGSYRGLK